MHKDSCMCDECINARIRKGLAENDKESEKRIIEQQSQDYIRRRGGEDPRRHSKSEQKRIDALKGKQ